MNIRSFAIRLLVWRCLKRPAPKVISWSSGQSKYRQNFFWVYLKANETRLTVRVTAAAKNAFLGTVHDPVADRVLNCRVPFEKIDSYQVCVSHYLNEIVVDYDDLFSFLRSELLFYPRLYLYWNRIAQFAFNKRKLVRQDRITILRRVVERALVDREYKVYDGIVATDFFGSRWIMHPDRNVQQNYYDAILRSLEETKDIARQGSFYVVTPRALVTLSEFEEQDRRHRDDVRQQTMLSVLTLALVFIGLVPIASQIATILKSLQTWMLSLL